MLQHPNVKVVTGPMRCGKSTEVMRLIQRARIAGKTVIVAKPATDDRTPHVSARVMDRDGNESWVHSPALIIETREDFHAFLATNADLYVLDEAQFFESWAVDELIVFLQEHSREPLEVVVSGLDLDFAGRPFRSMPHFLAIADEVLKLTGICMTCSSEAGRLTQRLTADAATVVVGDKQYTVRCRACHTILAAPEAIPAETTSPAP